MQSWWGLSAHNTSVNLAPHHEDARVEHQRKHHTGDCYGNIKLLCEMTPAKHASPLWREAALLPLGLRWGWLTSKVDRHRTDNACSPLTDHDGSTAFLCSCPAWFPRHTCFTSASLALPCSQRPPPAPHPLVSLVCFLTLWFVRFLPRVPCSCSPGRVCFWSDLRGFIVCPQFGISIFFSVGLSFTCHLLLPFKFLVCNLPASPFLHLGSVLCNARQNTVWQPTCSMCRQMTEKYKM